MTSTTLCHCVSNMSPVPAAPWRDVESCPFMMETRKATCGERAWIIRRHRRTPEPAAVRSQLGGAGSSIPSSLLLLPFTDFSKLYVCVDLIAFLQEGQHKPRLDLRDPQKWLRTCQQSFKRPKSNASLSAERSWKSSSRVPY